MSVASQELLISALKTANEAVSMDNQGFYPSALQAYEEAISILESEDVVAGVTLQDDKAKLLEITQMYSDRVDTILSAIPDVMSKTVVPEWGYYEVPVNYSPPIEECPQEADRKPYWLMKILQKTMTSGGYISPTFYITRDVWIQQGSAVPSIDVKYTSFDHLLIWLQKLKELDLSDLNALLKDLEEFDLVIFGIQNNLARKVKFVEEVKADNAASITTLKQLERAKGEEDVLAYVKLVIKLADASQFLDAWTTHFQTLPNTDNVARIQTLLKHISTFMYKTVCGILVYDLRVLAIAYLKKNKQEFLSF